MLCTPVLQLIEEPEDMTKKHERILQYLKSYVIGNYVLLSLNGFEVLLVGVPFVHKQSMLLSILLVD